MIGNGYNLRKLDNSEFKELEKNTMLETCLVEKRETTGTGSARALRRKGRIPAIIYGGNDTPETVTVDVRYASKALYQEGFLARLIDLEMDGKKICVLPRGIQVHPVSDIPIHMDFQKITKDCQVRVSIPVHYINTEKSPGLKRGGILNIVLHELSCQCLAQDIPKFITIDLEGLTVGESIHFNQVNLPQGATPINLDPNTTLATIVAPSGLKSKDASDPTEDTNTEPSSS